MNIYNKFKNLKKLNKNKVKKTILILILIFGIFISNKSCALNYNHNDGKQLLKEVGKTISTDSFLINFPRLNITQKYFDILFKEQLKLNNINQIVALMDLADKKQLNFIQNEKTIGLYKQYLNQKKQMVKNHEDLENIIDITQNYKKPSKHSNVNNKNLIKLPKKPVITSTTFTSLALEKDWMKRKIYTDFISEQRNENHQISNLFDTINQNKYVNLDKDIDFNFVQIFLATNEEKYKEQNDFLLDDKERFLNKHIALLLNYNKEQRKKLLKQSFQKAIDEKIIENSCMNFDILKNFVRSEQGFYQYKNIFPEIKFGNFLITNNKKDISNIIITPSFNKVYQNLLHYENQKSINKEELYKNLFSIKIEDENLLNKIILLSSVFNEMQINKNNNEINNQTLLEKHLDELAILSSGLNKNEFQDFLKASLTLIHYNSLICIY